LSATKNLLVFVSKDGFTSNCRYVAFKLADLARYNSATHKSFDIGIAKALEENTARVVLEWDYG